MKLTSELFNLENMDAEDIKAFINRYKNDPVLYAKEILQMDLDTNQINILNSVRDNRFSAILSAKGTGKTYTLAMLVMWYLSTNKLPLVYILANTQAQLTSSIWPTISKIFNRALNNSWFELTRTKIELKESPMDWMAQSITWSKDNPDALQGKHAENMLIIVDEGSGVPQEIFDALTSTMSEKKNKMLILSNPMRTSGYVYDIFMKPIDKFNKIYIDGFSSRWTDHELLREIIAEHGEDSDYVRMNIYGKFPKQAITSIITQEQYIENQRLEIVPKINDVNVLGIDLGRTSDKTVFATRKGCQFLNIHVESQMDTDKLINIISGLNLKYKYHYIVMDITGIGMYAQDAVKKICNNATFIGINFSESSRDNEDQYANVRAQLHMRTRDYMEAGGRLPTSEQYIEEMRNIEYFYNDKGKIQVLSKNQIKKQLGRSTDFADACNLTYMVPKNVLTNINSIRVKKLKTRSAIATLKDSAAWNG